MAAITRYAFAGLTLNGVSDTHVPVEPGSITVGNQDIIDGLKSAAQLKPDLIVNRGKRCEMTAQVFDPSLITAWEPYGSGLTYTGVTAYWRAFEENGGYSSTWLSWNSAQGILIPVSLSAGPQSKAVQQLRIIPLFSGGTLFTVGTSSGTAPTVTKAFYPTSITVASDAKAELSQLALNWSYGEVRFDNQVEPEYCFYDESVISGQAQVKDLTGDVTAARVIDGAKETVTTLFTDSENGANTVSNSLSNCWVRASIEGDLGQISFSQVA